MRGKWIKEDRETDRQRDNETEMESRTAAGCPPRDELDLEMGK